MRRMWRAVALVGIMLAAGAASAQVALAVTETTIDGPLVLPVGGEGLFTGEHRTRAGGQRVAATHVQLLVDDEPVASATTLGGTWSIRHAFPERGVYRVQAVAEEGLPQRSASRTLSVRVAVAPADPLGVDALALAASPSVSVSWLPPEDDGGAPLQSYVVERRADGGDWTPRATLAPTARSFRDENVPFGPVWEYAVSAKNAIGPSQRVVVPVRGDAPGAPTLAVTPVEGSASASLASTPGAGTTQRLLVERTLDGGASWQAVAVGSGAGFTTTDAFSFAGARPSYRASALSVLGASPAAHGVVLGAPAGAARDVQPEVTDVVRIRWSAPEDGGTVQAYRVLDRGAPVALVAGATRSAVVAAAGDGSNVWSVQALSLAGDGPAVGEASVPPPGAPTLQLHVIAATTNVSLAVAPADALARTIEIEKSANGVQWQWVATLPAASGTIVQTVDLATSVPVYRARAVGPTGASARVPAEVMTALPAQPVNLRIETAPSLRLAWDPAPRSQGYIVQGASTQQVGPTTTSVALSIAAGQSGTLTVRGISYVGQGPQSAPLAYSFDRPSAPVALAATTREGYGVGLVNLSWSAPASDGNATILNYEVWRKTGTGASVRVANLSASARSFTNDEVAGDGTPYVYEVRARNALGVGAGAAVSVAPDFGWNIQLTIKNFFVCETLRDALGRPFDRCAEVAPGGTFDRQGTSDTYARIAANFTGSVHRHGAPLADTRITVRATEWWDTDGEVEDWRFPTTDATGAFTVDGMGYWIDAPRTCRGFALRAFAATSTWPGPTVWPGLTMCP